MFMKIVNEGKPTPQAAESCTETDFFSPECSTAVPDSESLRIGALLFGVKTDEV